MTSKATALNFLRSETTLDLAVSKFASAKDISKQQALVAFANEILNSQGLLTETDFSRLVELDEKILSISEETSQKIFRVSVKLLLGKNPATTSFDSRTQLRMLKYLDLLLPSMRKDEKMVLNCLKLATLPEKSQQDLIRMIQDYDEDERTEVINEALLVLEAIHGDFEKAAFIKEISNLPKQDRAAILQIFAQTQSRNDAEKTISNQAMIVQSIAEIYQEKGDAAAKEAVTMSMNQLQGTYDGNEIAELITKAGETTPKASDSTQGSYKRDAEETTSTKSGQSKKRRKLTLEPSESDSDSVSESTNISGISDAQVKKDVQSILDLLPENHHGIFIKNLASMFANLSHSQRAIILKTVADSPKNHRVDVLKTTLTFENTVPRDTKEEVEKFIQLLPKNEQSAHLTSKLAEYLSTLTNDGKYIFTKLINAADITVRAELIKGIVLIKNPSLQTTIMNTLVRLPKELLTLELIRNITALLSRAAETKMAYKMSSVLENLSHQELPIVLRLATPVLLDRHFPDPSVAFQDTPRPRVQHDENDIGGITYSRASLPAAISRLFPENRAAEVIKKLDHILTLLDPGKVQNFLSSLNASDPAEQMEFINEMYEAL